MKTGRPRSQYWWDQWSRTTGARIGGAKYSREHKRQARELAQLTEAVRAVERREPD